MPYTYLDTVFNDSTMSGNSTHIFNRKTEAGCDSIVTLKLNVVNDLVELQENYFERYNFYPNPVNRDGMVYTTSGFTQHELDAGLTIELFNSVGVCVKRFTADALPFNIQGFETNGVFLIRITTTTNRVIHGKVIVK